MARLYKNKSEGKRSFLSANEKDIFTYSSKKQQTKSYLTWANIKP